MRSALEGVPGVHEVEVDFDSDSATVRVEAGVVSPAIVIEQLEARTGYKVWLRSTEIETKPNP